MSDKLNDLTLSMYLLKYRTLTIRHNTSDTNLVSYMYVIRDVPLSKTPIMFSLIIIKSHWRIFQYLMLSFHVAASVPLTITLQARKFV